MKVSLVLLSFAALFALSLGDLESDFEEFCDIPSGPRTIIIDCVVEALDDTSLTALRATEQCAGITLTSALNDLCRGSTRKMERLEGCDQIGDREPTIDEEEAKQCVQRKLGRRRK